MDILNTATLELQPDKWKLLRPAVGYLGHRIAKEGVRPDPKNLEAVKHLPIPKNPKNMKQFLGLADYYRKFIERLSKIATALNQLLKKDMKFNWLNKQQEVFDTEGKIVRRATSAKTRFFQTFYFNNRYTADCPKIPTQAQ